MNAEKKKGKKGITSFAALVVGIVLGLVCVGFLGTERIKEMSFPAFLGRYVGAILLLIPAFYLQMILHETGHLVCGLLSGYRLSYFRIGGLTAVKEENGISWKKLKMPGTGGQCMMVPPEMVNGEFPATLYNLGGVLANLVVSLVFFLLFLAVKEPRWLQIFFLWVVVAGIFMALTNGIPMETQDVPNDGFNAKNLGKDPAARKSFWVQLTANDLQVRGVRLKDMPAEWFMTPSREEMKNGMTAAMGVFSENRNMDEENYEAAKEEIEVLLGEDVSMAGIYRNFLILDRLFLKVRELLLKGEDPAKSEEPQLKEDLAFWNSPEMRQYRKVMSNYPAILRTEYVTARYLENDPERAEKAKQELMREDSSYPLKGETLSERERILSL